MEASFFAAVSITVSAIWVLGYFLIFKKTTPKQTNASEVKEVAQQAKKLEKPKQINLTLEIDEDLELDYEKIAEMTFSWKSILEKAEILPHTKKKDIQKTVEEAVTEVKKTNVEPHKAFILPTNYVKFEKLSKNLL